MIGRANRLYHTVVHLRCSKTYVTSTISAPAMLGRTHYPCQSGAQAVASTVERDPCGAFLS
jgi:hypothetical protein